jgi:hypothetical protein
LVLSENGVWILFLVHPVIEIKVRFLIWKVDLQNMQRATCLRAYHW